MSGGKRLRWVMSATVSSTSRITKLGFCCFSFSLTFFINEDRKTVSSRLLQDTEIEEVAYVKKTIATRGTHILYCTHCGEIIKQTFDVYDSKMSVLIVCLDTYKILSMMKSLM